MKNVVVTGAVHVGKSTACLKVVQWARRQGYGVRGIATTPLYDPAGAREGFEIHNLENGQCRILAHVGGEWEQPRVGPYRFDPAALRWGKDIIVRALAEGCDLLILDEIGRLELEQAAGFHGVLSLLASATVPRMLIVVRDTLLNAFRSQVPALQFSTFEVTQEYRDIVPGEIIGFLFDSARPGC